MTPPKLSMYRLIVNYAVYAAMLLLFASHAAPVRADSTDGKTPLALQPGTPAGSYALSDFDNINPYNGALNFRLPLLNIGGRGTAGYTMTLPIEQKWRIHTTPIYLIVYEEGGGPPLPDPQTTYLYFPAANWWSGIKPGYGPGVLQGRVAQFDAQVCPDGSMNAVETLTRFTFTAPDGTEFELRDSKSGGAPAGVALCAQTGYNRGKIFVTADGSAATFISDQDIIDYVLVPNGNNDLIYASGFLLLPDGTRYRFDNGTVSWLRDRNGNTITFTYDSSKRVTTIKDSLNRQVSITYATSSVLYDEIVYKGFGGAARTLRVNYAFLQDSGSLRTGYSPQTYAQLFPLSNASGSLLYNPKIIRSVTLPNDKQYQFQYNSYGELARVVLPTGGAFEYDHASGVAGDASGVTGGAQGEVNVYRRVTTKRVYTDGTTLENKMTFSNTESVPCSGCVVIDQFGSDGTTRISQRRLFYEGDPILSFSQLPTEYAPWKDGKELQSEMVAANGSTILQRSTNTWQQPLAGASWPLTQAETNASAKTNNPQVTQVVTTLEPAQANKVSKQTFAYDKYTNKTDVSEYDFGVGNPGALVRRTHTDFLTSSYDTLNPSAANLDLNQTSHIRNLPLQVSLFDAANVERARATTEYDNYTLDGADCLHSLHCGLIARANISGLDGLFGVSYTKRGNLTASTRYLLSNGSVTGSVSSYLQYDVAGNVVRVLDPRSTLTNNIATTIEYDDRFGAPDNEGRSNSVPSELTGFTSFAFPTKVTNALGHTTYAQFDYYLGQPVNEEDANGVVASGSFNDSLDRPKQIRRAIGTGAENQTSFAYDDTLRLVTVSSDKDAVNDNLLVSEVEYDPMGRTIAQRQYEGGTHSIVTKTEYDALGRPYKTSYPFRPWQSETPVWTTTAFDALGRVLTVTTPDNAVVGTSYSGNSVTVTDQAGKVRKSVTDALGRLIEVYEDPAGVNYQTSYLYDALDNLARVTQGSQQRFFMYDSLKRLIRADNPEQETLSALNLTDPVTSHSNWSAKYEYDNNGNLTFKTDARGVVTGNLYDELNRLTTVLYRINGQPDPNTGDIQYVYDNATYGKGRLWLTYRWGTKPSHTTVGEYDAMGRVKQLWNDFGDGQGGWLPGYGISRNYNLAGAVTSQTYPSGHTVNYAYDTAGRTSSVGGNLGDGTTRSYASSFVYNARSQVTQELFGTATPLYHKLQYNIRGQLWDVRVSTNPDVNGSMNRGGLQYFYEGNLGYGTSGPDNNGNVLFANTYSPEDENDVHWAITRQRYNYDSLNRLKSVTEYFVNYNHAESQQSVQTYDYDRWGNRTINTAQTSGAGINNTAFEIETARNRLYSPGDLALSESQRRIRYDQAGNQTKDTYTGYGTAIFDGDNHIVAIQDKFGSSSTYTYNANSQRVRRKINNQETWQIYGIDGELVAEYAANGAVGAPQKEYGYRDGQLLITAEAPVTNRTNVALSANGATATASSYLGAPYNLYPSYVNDGQRTGVNDTLWLDNTYQSFPDWVQIDFNGTKTINEIDVVTQQDGYNNPTQPTLDTTFTTWGATAFDVQYWNGTSWVTVPNGSVTGNNKVWRQFTFADITTSKIRITVNGVVDNAYSRVVEVEAWTPASKTNYALSANGGSATASSYLGAPYNLYPSYVNDGQRTGVNDTLWLDNTYQSFPDWVQIDFNGTKTINEIDVVTQQDSTNPVEPTLAMTFASWGITAFEVQYWNGTSWVTVPNGSVTGNNKVWRQFTFADITTSKIRVTVNSGVDNVYSRVVEVEAWGDATGSSSAKINWLVPDHLGTPRIILDQTGAFANVRRHDYLPFGEEVYAGTGGRTTAMGYAAGDNVRQQFTAKERDTETGLDYFLARYYSASLGRFQSIDPYNINLERQQSDDWGEAERGFLRYISQPQHWNDYTYVLNNPLKFVDPDGWSEDNKFHGDLLGKKIEVVVDPKILKRDPDALRKVKESMTKAFDKINQAHQVKPFSQEQLDTIGRLKKIQVNGNKGIEGMVGNTFNIKFDHAINPDTDILSGNIMHDSRHAEQMARGLSFNEKTAFPMEMEASTFVLGVIETRGWNNAALNYFRSDAANGHLSHPEWKDKSTAQSRGEVFNRMSTPRRK